MALVANYIMPRFGWGWQVDGPDVIPPNSIAPPPGVRVAVPPRNAARPNSAYKAIGITHLYINAGTPDTTVQFAERAMIDSCNSLYSAAGGGTFTSWSESTVRGVASAINPGNKAQMYLTEEAEYMNINAGVSATAWNTSNQSLWFNQQMASNIRAAGGEYYAGYDGYLDIGSLFFSDLNAIRTGLASNSAAYTLAQGYTGFGQGFYSRDEGAFRGGCIKMYSRGDMNKNRFIATNLVHMRLDKKARAHKGWNSRVACVFFPGYDEILSGAPRSTTYRRNVPVGGVATRPTFPQWGYSAQIFLQCMAMLEGFDIFNWESAERFGNDPNVVLPSDYNNFSYSGPATRAATVQTYTTGPVGYPGNPQGGCDIPIAAIHLATFLRSHAASSPAYARYKIGTGSYNTVSESYLVDCFESGKIYAYVLSSGNNRSLLVFDGNDPGQTRQVTVDLGGGEHTFTSCGQFFHASNHTV